MVYIAADGTVHQGERPWDMKRIKDTFWSFLHSIELFIQTLIPLPMLGNSDGARRPGSLSSGSGNRSSGRSGGSSNRPSGGFRTISDIRPPPPAFGGCSGGSCGM